MGILLHHLSLYALRTCSVVFSPQSPRVLSHGHISKMADGGGNKVLEEDIEQQLSRIVKGQLFSKAFLFPFPSSNRGNNISCRRTLWKP